jgi:hypothetical protein
MQQIYGFDTVTSPSTVYNSNHLIGASADLHQQHNIYMNTNVDNDGIGLSTSQDFSVHSCISWRDKVPLFWSNEDILSWINDMIHISNAGQLEQVRAENFRDLTGPLLCTMPETELVARDHRFGQFLYGCLQALLNNWRQVADDKSMKVVDMWSTEDGFNLYGGDNDSTDTTAVDQLIDEVLTCLDARDNIQPTMFDYGDDSLDSSFNFTDLNVNDMFPPVDSTQPPCLMTSSCHWDSALTLLPEAADAGMANNPLPSSVVGRQRRRTSGTDVTPQNGSRRRRRSCVKTHVTHLWQFMRSLLDSREYNPTYVKWENKDDGVFRIVPGQSPNVARLWGIKKNNPTMTFEKMSRSLRWCRKHGFLTDVPKTGQYPKKLCFRFGDLASNWRATVHNNQSTTETQS